MQIGGWRQVAEQLEFLVAWPDAFWGQDEPQVGHFGVAEETFGQIDFE